MTSVARFARLASAIALVVCTTAWLGAQAPSLSPSADALYSDASAKEAAVRRVLAAPKPSTTVLRAVRTVVLDYEAVVRRYPTSAFCDDALWRAALLSSDAFRAFGDPREQASATRLLQMLSSEYPASKYVRQTPALVAELSMLPVKGPVIVESEAKDSAVMPPVAMVNPAPRGIQAAVPAVPVATAASPTVTATPARTASPTRPAARPSMSPGAIATITAIRRVTLPDVVRVTIELDREVTFHDDRLENPSRVFLDLPGTQTAKALRDQTLRFDDDIDLIRQIRLGRHPNNVTRIVLEAEGVTSYSVYTLYNPFRLVIDSSKGSRSSRADFIPASITRSTTFVPRVPSAVMSLTALPPFPSPKPSVPLPLRARRTDVPMWLQVAPNAVPTASAAIREASTIVLEPLAAIPTPQRTIVMPTVLSAGVAAPPAPPAPPARGERLPATPVLEPPSRMLSGGLSLARQLGLGVSRIVIDPGHGGHDPGTKGGGFAEADLVLDVALRLEKMLLNVPGTAVVLTRRADEFIPLQERTAIANREGADLFLSIHANSSNASSARGVETYFLNFANNLSAAATAARENAASGQSMGELPDVVRTIALNNKLAESKDFATHVQREMMSRLHTTNKGMRDFGVKQAPFQVLIGAAMPSILAEVAFLSNPQEARLVKQSAYRQRIAEALYTAVRKYQGSLTHTRIAQQ